MTSPVDSVAEPRTELTIRALILGVIITVAFTAANVFFGLKAGLTFATSIPAAVISMALLRKFKNSTVQENNIVQTVASAAGTLSSIIFVLPGLIIIGWWTGFPYWVSFAICALGGILGVMYSIPLRRALVTNSELPYPEGVACAEVLKVGSPGAEGTAHGVEESRSGLLAVTWGAIVAAAFAVIVATRVFASDVASYFRVGDRGGVTGFDFALSMALFAVGHLVGLWVGIAMLLGAVIGWGWGVPHFSALVGMDAGTAAADLAQATWSQKVRFVGAGTIGVAAIWTLGQAGQAGGDRPDLGDGRGEGASGRQPRLAAAHRARHPDRRRRHGDGGVLRAAGVPARAVQHRDGPGCAHDGAGHRRPHLHRRHGLPGLDGVRLHGRPDRFVEQSAVGHRHPRGDRRGAAARVRNQAPAGAGT